MQKKGGRAPGPEPEWLAWPDEGLKAGGLTPLDNVFGR